MISLYEDNEVNLLDELRDYVGTQLCLPNKRKNKRVGQNILSKIKEDGWVNSSGKSDPPPDFYHEGFRLMIEVMRINDTEYYEQGKLINPEARANRRLAHSLPKNFQNQIKENNIRLLINADTKLPTQENHSYNRYKKSMKRTLQKHIKHIKNYRETHPGYKLIFFIYDESRAYGEYDISKIETPKEGDIIEASIHYCFIDNELLNIFINEDIDYVIWYTPYKLYRTILGRKEVPRLCFYDIKNIKNNIKTIDFQNVNPLEE